MKLVILNHKMNINYNSLDDYIEDIKKIDNKNIDLIVCPSNLYLLKFKEKGFVIGAQNVSFDKVGNYTGEISASQLNSIGAKYCIVGHSERRKFLDEDDNVINRKVKLLLEENIKPILCVGENLNEKQTSKQVILLQLANTLEKIRKEDLKNIIIAYEPVWSVGTGILPDLDYIEDMIMFIKSTIGSDVKVIYGGSVNENNIEALKKIDIIDGFLLGNISLDTKKLSNLTNRL